MTTGQQVGIGTIGADGFIGIGTVLGIPQFAYWSTVLVETTGYRIPAPLFRRAFNDSKALRQTTLAYVGRLLVEYSRLAACHRIHSQRQRLARWLLTATDRAGQPVLPVTHDVLAQMVGARGIRLPPRFASFEQAGPLIMPEPVSRCSIARS